MSTPDRDYGEPMLRWFDHGHLAPELQKPAAAYRELALELIGNLPRSPERTVALRKLLESKDAAVRSTVAALGDSLEDSPDQR